MKRASMPYHRTSMQIPSNIQPFWSAFAATRPDDDVTSRFFEAFHFTDREASADELADLVVAGTKRATAGLLWDYEAEGEPITSAGQLSVVTDWAGNPRCVIETRSVAIVPFDDVDEEFAATEGEGDKSLRYWRESHWEFFERACARIGRTPDLRMPVVCERFEVVYRPEAR
jgi:uncharacterized protein YhfF